MRPARTNAPVSERLANHERILSGNVSFGVGATDQSRNILGAWVTGIVTPATPNTEFSVTYSLQQSPYALVAKYWDLKYKSAACDVYASGTPWTATTAYFKCTVASVTISLFLH